MSQHVPPSRISNIDTLAATPSRPPCRTCKPCANHTAFALCRRRWSRLCAALRPCPQARSSQTSVARRWWASCRQHCGRRCGTPWCGWRLREEVVRQVRMPKRVGPGSPSKPAAVKVAIKSVSSTRKCGVRATEPSQQRLQLGPPTPPHPSPPIPHHPIPAQAAACTWPVGRRFCAVPLSIRPSTAAPCCRPGSARCWRLALLLRRAVQLGGSRRGSSSRSSHSCRLGFSQQTQCMWVLLLTWTACSWWSSAAA